MSSHSLFATILVSTGILHAAPLIYEPFDFPVGDLSTESGGAWSDSGSVVGSGSLTYGSLETAGNKVEGMSDDTSWTSTGTALNGFLDDGDTLWFSVLFNAESISTNPDFGFALATDQGRDVNNIPLSTTDGGNGLGFRVKGNNGGLVAASWSGGALSNGTAQSIAAQTTHLIVGEMIFGATDTVNLYLPDTDLNLGSVVASTTAALDQTAFDTITFMNKGDNDDDVDEIRFGESYEDVVPAAVAGVEPRITSITSVGTDLWELTLIGEADTDYEFYSSTTLDFTAGTLIENLVQGDLGDAGTVGETNNSVLTTDANGDGKVRIALTGSPRDFVRAESTP